MPLKLNIQQWFRPVELPPSLQNRRTLFWLILSLSVPLYFGGLTIAYLFQQDYVIQDDARQHVVFLQRLIDPQLFPNDWIANYFETIAPVGYKSLYGLVAKLGITPLNFAKVVPIFLSLITTVYLFLTCLFIFPIPLSGFLATLILNQHLWLNDDLVSATPRAFIYPIFSAFLYYLLNRSLIPVLITIGIQACFFPQLVFVQALILILRLVRWRSLKLSDQKADYILGLSGTLVCGLVLIPYALNLSTFGSVITAEQMRSLPEYGLSGRNEYFGVSFWQFWLLGNSGIRIPVFPSIILAGLGLPFVRRSRLPLFEAMTAEVKVLWQVLAASLVMYGLAHLFLLRLHFPSRYTYHTLRIILAIAAAITLTILLNAGWRWWRYKRRIQSRLTLRDNILVGLTASLIAAVLIVPALPQIFLQFQGWIVGDAPALYQYLAIQPKDTLIASLTPEANNLPAFAQRSTFIGREFALPHHPKYYEQFKQRVVDMIHLQYTPNASEMLSLIDQHSIDFLLLDRADLSSDQQLQQDWLLHSSFQATALKAADRLHQGIEPAILPWIDRCSVVSTEQWVLIQTSCMKQNL